MATTTKPDQERITGKSAPTTQDDLATGASQAALGIIVCLAGTIGLWGFACLYHGLAESGSLTSLVRTYMRALGM